jgi:hypothetical protein
MMIIKVLSVRSSVKSSFVAATMEAVMSNTTRTIASTNDMYRTRIAKLRLRSREKITSRVFNNL